MPKVYAAVLCPQARGEWLPLTFGATMYVVVGDPIDFAPLIAEYRAAGRTDRDLHAEVVSRLDRAMRALQLKTIAMADADESGRSDLDRPKYPWRKAAGQS